MQNDFSENCCRQIGVHDIVVFRSIRHSNQPRDRCCSASLTRVTSVIGTHIAISNACTLSLVKFDDAEGNKLVLEGY